jgi:sulfatase maturation enzyme AslB (radical SAM superfamily)
MNKETFCAYPFNTIFLGADGGVKTCCSAQIDIGDINKQSIQEILQGPVAQGIRQAIIEERWHPQCEQCQKLEAMGARSERVDTGSANKFEIFESATKETFELQKLDLRWSNLCNLACNYCYEYFSSKWSILKGIKVNANKAEAEDSLFTLIAENIDSLDSIETINLLGGEPLLQKQNHKLIDLLPTKNYYILSNLSIDLPNNTIAPKLIANENAQWGISFDTVGDRFEYVRHGAEWTTFVSNLRYLNDQGVKTINAHPLYCTYSAFNLCEYYDFIISEGYFNEVYWCAIQNIRSLNVFKLPDNFKHKALAELDKCISKYGASGYDMSALENIRDQLITTIGRTGDEWLVKKLEFTDWTHATEVKYLSDKKHSFNELWPDFLTEWQDEQT